MEQCKHEFKEHMIDDRPVNRFKGLVCIHCKRKLNKRGIKNIVNLFAENEFGQMAIEEDLK